MYLKPILLSSLAYSLLLGCGPAEKAGKDGNTSPAKVGVSCLAKYEDKIGEIFPLSVLQEIVDVQGGKPEMKVTNSGSLTGVSWSWPGSRMRTMEIAGNTMEFPIDQQVSLSHFRRLDKKDYGPKDGKTYVEQNYRSISKEEMAQTQARMQAQIQERVRKGELTEEQAKLAGGLGGSLMGNERIVESIEGVGDAARWTEKDKTLAVGHRNIAFTIYVDIAQDPTVNLNTAIALAKRLLRDCE